MNSCRVSYFCLNLLDKYSERDNGMGRRELRRRIQPRHGTNNAHGVYSIVAIGTVYTRLVVYSIVAIGAVYTRLVPAVEACAASGDGVETEGLGSLRAMPPPRSGPPQLKVYAAHAQADAGSHGGCLSPLSTADQERRRRRAVLRPFHVLRSS